jgi:RNA polymerase sigma factor (sigma-70 family)
LVGERTVDLIEVDAALSELGKRDPRAARVVEHRLFAGLTLEETAEVLGISMRTVERDWVFARAWMFERLRGNA